MRCSRVGLGLSLGLLLGISFWHCSFSLPERSLCTGTDMGCPAGADLGNPMIDMAPEKDPNDPSLPGPFKVAMLNVAAPNGIKQHLLLAPSDDGVAISNQLSKYPMVLVAPARDMAPASMQEFAERLCSHGFIVAVYQVNDQSDHSLYVNTALGYLGFLRNATEDSIKNRLDTTRTGLMGYQLGAKISVELAVQDAKMGALFLLDPVDLFTISGTGFSGVTELGRVTLAKSGTVAILGEDLSPTGSPPCIPQAQQQTGYRSFYEAAKSPVLSIGFGGANLGDFIPSFSDPNCTMGSTAPSSRTQGLARKYAAAYFNWLLNDNLRARAYLLGNEFTVDMQMASLTQQSK